MAKSPADYVKLEMGERTARELAAFLRKGPPIEWDHELADVAFEIDRLLAENAKTREERRQRMGR